MTLRFSFLLVKLHFFFFHFFGEPHNKFSVGVSREHREQVPAGVSPGGGGGIPDKCRGRWCYGSVDIGIVGSFAKYTFFLIYRRVCGQVACLLSSFLKHPVSFSFLISRLWGE